jgi:phosphopantothenoylcysteine decarboxylase/phosphopantothenate--cysteine ligase
MAKILLGVSGGIAAYKAVEFVRLAVAAGHSLRVVMTASSRRFIGADTFEGILGSPVLSSEFEKDPMRGTFPGEPLPGHEPIGHLALVESADAFLVAPASANTIAKLAHGQADSMLTTSFIACEAPRLVAPAMNDRMYLDRSTADNLELLRQRGVEVIEPSVGALASKGEYGVGRLPDPAELLERVESALRRDLGGLRVLVTAGGTREPIDPVRFIGNRSSGRMGFALADRARARGADVTVIAANVSLATPPGVERIDVETTSELADACRRQLPECDLLLMAAAPADFRPEQTADSKLRREGDGLELRLRPTEDILASLSASAGPQQTLVGFAAEFAGDGEGRAREKLERKGLDLVVMNDVSDERIGFDSDQNAVTLVTAGEASTHGIADKGSIADVIIDRATQIHRGGGG